MKLRSNHLIKVPWAEEEKRIFGAFPWNSSAMSMYEEILENIKHKYKWNIQYGSKYKLVIDDKFTNEIKQSDIKQFISRNKQLYDIFVQGISACDIFIADITNHNPNVFLELGIAIQQDKNILIVTSQEIDKLPFDIRGFEAKSYKTKEELQKIIEKEIQMYTAIKEQTFTSDGPKNIYKLSTGGILINNNAMEIKIPKMKNLRIKLDFRFIYSTNHELDWFGIHFRTQGNLGSPSELALVRYSGKTRSVTWPEQRKEENGNSFEGFNPENWNSFEVLIDENELKVWIHQQLVLTDNSLMVENFGALFIRGNLHNHPSLFKNGQPGKPKNQETDKNTFLEIEYRNIEILDLNTTTNIAD